jgi:hypothetical protein
MAKEAHFRITNPASSSGKPGQAVEKTFGANLREKRTGEGCACGGVNVQMAFVWLHITNRSSPDWLDSEYGGTVQAPRGN